MKKLSIIQIAISILFLAALGLGLVQRQDNIFGSHSIIQKFSGQDGSLENYFTRAKDLANKDSNKSTVTFLAVGDIMLSRGVADDWLKNSPAHGPYSLNWPFLKSEDLLKSTNFNFGNLESPIAPQGKEIIGGHAMIFGAPSNLSSSLQDFNFKIVNLANNHAMDLGLNGLKNTTAVLDNLSIKHVGTGENLNQAWEPSIIEQNGMKICFVGASYASVNDSGKTINSYVARIQDIENLKLSIENSKSLCDFVVVTMHAGTEYTRKPNQAQINFAHTAIDYGADVVIGAHPHWIQTTEKYCPMQSSLPQSASDAGRDGEGAANCSNPKYIFYSLGNFIFDQNFSQDTKEGLTLKVTISKFVCHPDRPNAPDGVEGSLNPISQHTLSDSSDALGMTNTGACLEDLQGQKTTANLEQIELIPVIIQNSQPRPATEEETKKILEKIGQIDTILK